MGYYTSFELAADDSNTEKHVAEIAEQKEFNPFEDACKWGWHDRDMKAHSRKYPGVVFSLTGKGQGGGNWRNYYKNGKVQEVGATITYGEYDESRLE